MRAIISGALVIGVATAQAGCAASGDGDDTLESQLGEGGAITAPSATTGGDLGGYDPGQPAEQWPGGPPCDNDSADGDLDGDGFTVSAGDCNDCSPEMNPGAFDFDGNKADEDCNGTNDDEPSGCDASIINLGSTDPLDGARAMDLCRQVQGQSWGVSSAAYVKADGSPGVDARGHGLLDHFGDTVVPQNGNRMLVISSGTARNPSDPGYQDPSGAWLGTQSLQPSGFPIPSPSCTQAPAQVPDAYDPVALQLSIRVPTNAKSFEIDFNFYTDEFPTFICKQYNDFFVALQTPAPPGSQLGNIAFDNFGNPVSVNNSYLEVCVPQTAGGKSFACPLGPGELAGTGFEGTMSNLDPTHAATSWLVTRSPVDPGSEITLRLAVWDAGDFVLASTVLIDNFRWEVEGADAPTTVPKPK